MSRGNYDQPGSPGYGKPAQEVQATPLHRVGRPDTYQSVYGYQKQRFPVLVVDKNGDGDEVIGYIKEEVVLDRDGNEAGRVYYTREGWKKHGQLRFYDSPEALLVAVGKAVWDGSEPAPGKEEAPKEPSDEPAAA